MRTIIAGDRNFTDYQKLHAELQEIQRSGWKITEVISGCARGADTLGEAYAKEYQIPVDRYPANWERYGRAAGPIRNKAMGEGADALVAFLAEGSHGTANMIKQAQELGIKFIKVIEV